jgi:hypothetical protein
MRVFIYHPWALRSCTFSGNSMTSLQMILFRPSVRNWRWTAKLEAVAATRHTTASLLGRRRLNSSAKWMSIQHLSLCRPTTLCRPM